MDEAINKISPAGSVATIFLLTDGAPAASSGFPDTRRIARDIRM